MIAALVQHPPVYMNLAASIERAAKLIAAAAADGATLAVFPETWLPGYPVWLDHSLGAALWNYPPANALFDHLLRNAVSASDGDLDPLSEAAGKYQIDVVMGLNERLGRTLYNSTAYIGRDGSLSIRRKLMPTYNEKLIWGQGDGNGLKTWSTQGMRIGSLICWEHWMPLARAALHGENETLHVAQWPAVGELHQLASRHYAFEGQCIVLAAGCVLDRNDVLAGFTGAGGNHEGLALLESLPASEPLKNGGSAAIGPDADYLLPPVYDARATLIVELPTSPASPVLDVAGHYARDDIFELRIDRRSRRGITELPNDRLAAAALKVGSDGK